MIQLEMQQNRNGIDHIKKIVILITLLLLFSCRDNKIIINENSIYKYLPDNFFLDDTINNGYIVYHSSFDTIKLKKGESRDIFLYITISRTPINRRNRDFLKIYKKYTFATIKDGNDTIPIFGIKFDSIGKYYLNGYIEDQLWIASTNKKNDSVYTPVSKTYFTHLIQILKKD